MRRYYSNVAPPVALSSPVTIGATSLPVPSTAGYPAEPFTVAIERGTANEELVLVQVKNPTSFDNCIRGYDGTTPVAHVAGSAVEHAVGALDYDEANELRNMLAVKGSLLTFGTALMALPVGTGFIKGDPTAPGGLSYGYPVATEVGAVPLTQKGAANGVATLDASALIPAAQMPHDSSVFVQTQVLETIGSHAVIPAGNTAYSFSITLPAGWGSMDVDVAGVIQFNYVNGSGFRRVQTAVYLNGVGPGSAGSEYWDSAWGSTNLGRNVMLLNAITGATATVTAAVITTLTAGVGNVTAEVCRMHALKKRRS